MRQLRKGKNTMLYDVYEISMYGVYIERIYQPSEPMYDTTALIKIIKERINTQHGAGKVTVKSIGQVENVGGEPPKI